MAEKAIFWKCEQILDITMWRKWWCDEKQCCSPMCPLLLNRGSWKGSGGTLYSILYKIWIETFLMENMNLFLQEAYSEENNVQGDTSREASESSRVNLPQNSPNKLMDNNARAFHCHGRNRIWSKSRFEERFTNMFPKSTIERWKRRKRRLRRHGKTTPSKQNVFKDLQRGKGMGKNLNNDEVMSLQSLLKRPSQESQGFLRTPAPIKEELLIKVASHFSCFEFS